MLNPIEMLRQSAEQIEQSQNDNYEMEVVKHVLLCVLGTQPKAAAMLTKWKEQFDAATLAIVVQELNIPVPLYCIKAKSKPDWAMTILGKPEKHPAIDRLLELVEDFGGAHAVVFPWTGMNKFMIAHNYKDRVKIPSKGLWTTIEDEVVYVEPLSEFLLNC